MPPGFGEDFVTVLPGFGDDVTPPLGFGHDAIMLPAKPRGNDIPIPMSLSEFLTMPKSTPEPESLPRPMPESMSMQKPMSMSEPMPEPDPLFIPQLRSRPKING